MQKLLKLIRDLGPLRTMLVLVVLLVIACAPFADGTFHTGWRFWFDVLGPTFLPVLAFTLPLDITMAGVFMASNDDLAEKRRYRRIIWVDAGLLVILLLSWTPFIIRLTSPIN